jgi:hypothetical protein
MRGGPKLALLLALAMLLATGFSACGGGDSSDSTGSSTAATTQDSAATTIEDKGSALARRQGKDEKGAAGFIAPGGDNSIQTFGDEGSGAELDEVTAVLTGYLRARAADEWAKECGYLAKGTVAPLEQLASRSPQLKGKGCAAVLEALTGGVPAPARANTLTGAVDSLRVEGEQGFALYHGPKGVDYYVPMAKEDGRWKVAGIGPSEFP